MATVVHSLPKTAYRDTTYNAFGIECVNGIGYVANSLFGVLDDNFAKNTKKISDLRNKTKNISRNYGKIKLPLSKPNSIYSRELKI